MDIVTVAVAAAIILLAVAAVGGAAREIRIPRLAPGIRAGMALAAVVCVALALARRPAPAEVAAAPVPEFNNEMPQRSYAGDTFPTVDTITKGLTAAEESAAAARPSPDPTHEEVMGAEGEDTLWAPTFEGMLGTWTVTWRDGGMQGTAWIHEFEGGGGTVNIRRIYPDGREQSLEADLEISGKGDVQDYVAANARLPLNGRRMVEEYPLYFTLKHLPNGEWTYAKACIRETCHDVTVLRRPPWTRYYPP